jgi:beta-glucanase (GH16 family)
VSTATWISGASAAQEAAAAAAAADVAVVVVRDYGTEERDKLDLALPGEQDALVRAVAAANPRTVVVLTTGQPTSMPWLDAVPAVLEAWYPGQEQGNAVARVLFGDVNPSGKLPITFPRALEDAPPTSLVHEDDLGPSVTLSEGLLVGYRWYDAKGTEPLFPFGHGLSYTTFRYGGLDISGGATTRVSFSVTNDGPRDGAEVAQVYIAPCPGDPARPPWQLAGFMKVALAAGASQVIGVDLAPEALQVWSLDAHAWQTPACDRAVRVGSSSRDVRLTGEIRVDASGSASMVPKAGGGGGAGCASAGGAGLVSLAGAAAALALVRRRRSASAIAVALVTAGLAACGPGSGPMPTTSTPTPNPPTMPSPTPNPTSPTPNPTPSPTPTPGEPTPVAALPPGYQLAWHDEFDGAALDTSRWNAFSWARGDAIDTPDAVTVADGVLRITTYTENGVHKTGFLSTEYGKYQATRGYFEARIRFSTSPGEWCSFWLTSPTIGNPKGDALLAGAEIDVVEHRVIDESGWALGDLAGQNVIWDGYGAGRQNVHHVAAAAGGAPIQGQWHTFAVLWDEVGYTFYVDADAVWTTSSGLSSRSEYLLLTCEILDHDWAGNIPAGGYGSRASSTTHMDVDWVRVWQKP